MSLSGGQRQRLSLARAIIADPRILVLDDTLSALDVHTEAEVTEALGRVLRDVTGIVVAHRASTVLLADRVALLENGTVTRVGTHAELLADAPEYRYLLAADEELAEAGPVSTTDWRGQAPSRRDDENPAHRRDRSPGAGRPAPCWDRCCGPTSRWWRCWPWSSCWRTRRGCRCHCWCSAVSTTASRRSSPAAPRGNCS